MRWALVPAFSKSVKAKQPWFNAQVETLRDKGSFFGIKADAAHRALIVADSFYEWPKSEDVKAQGNTAPMRFVVDEGRPFAFAGLWVNAPHVGDGPVESCTIITCDAHRNRVMAPVHHRMPVILPDVEEMLAWLDPGHDSELALKMCEPLAADRLSASFAMVAVNNVKLPEGPELLRPDASFTAEEPQQLSLS